MTQRRDANDAALRNCHRNGRCSVYELARDDWVDDDRLIDAADADREPRVGTRQAFRKPPRILTRKKNWTHGSRVSPGSPRDSRLQSALVRRADFAMIQRMHKRDTLAIAISGVPNCPRTRLVQRNGLRGSGARQSTRTRDSVVRRG